MNEVYHGDEGVITVGFPKMFVGIDPGKGGGLACICGDDIDVIKMPIAGAELDLPTIADWFWKLDNTLHYKSIDSGIVVCIEKVHAMPGQGVSSMFKFGFVTGAIHGVVATYNFPLQLVTPQAWKKVVLEGVKKDKNAAIEYCRRVYPSVSLLPTERSRKAHNGMADALCIATYASIKYL